MKSRVITLCEYETLQIGDFWDAENRIVPVHIVAALEKLQASSRRDIFKISRKTITAQQFVGTVGLGEWAIDILPKVDQLDKDDTRALGKSSSTLLDAFMRLYTRKLASEWRRGHIASYRKREANRTALKGKLLFSQQIRKNLIHPERFFTSTDEFMQDVPLSRLLKAGLHVCRQYSFGNEVRRDAMELLAEFDEVGDYGFTDDELKRLSVNRQTERFGPIVELAKLFLGERVPDRAGRGMTYSLVFDMNVVFERFIGNIMRRHVCPPEHSATLQLSSKSLLRADKKPYFRLKPDISIRSDGKPFCIVDTKWKRLDCSKPNSNVSQTDMYQMYAYGKEYDVPVVILLYPQSDGMAQKSKVDSYRHNLCIDEGVARRIDVCQVDISKPLLGSVGSVCDQLGGLVRGAISG
jgi:5-methylcytosine-specific restriction enzyme subunit McrC